MSIRIADQRKFPVAACCFGIVIGLLAAPDPSTAQILGLCSNCHTMHNSQDNLPMTLVNPWDTPGEPQDQLLRASCLGCHAQGAGAENIQVSGLNRFPQVYHDDAAGDLAGGNFWYINNGADPSSAKGHNIVALNGSSDSILTYPPGFTDDGSPAHLTNIISARLTCAGDPGDADARGCHGNRTHRGPDSAFEGIRGAHHDNVNGAVDPDVDPGGTGHGYRFLVGVKGYEDSDWQATKSDSDHNEYWGQTAPVQLGCGAGGALSCHGTIFEGDEGVLPPDGTISQYCASCHGNFHTLQNSTIDDGIGPDAIAPFIRHPTDLVIPARDEYLSYTVYNLDAPVARTTAVPAASSSLVSPGSDAVMCLSCHYSHGGPYNDMLRWSYTTMVAGNGGAFSDTGCFTCHTTKD